MEKDFFDPSCAQDWSREDMGKKILSQDKQTTFGLLESDARAEGASQTTVSPRISCFQVVFGFGLLSF